MEENCRMTGQKRKSCSSPEPPRKRKRCSEVAVEASTPSPNESPKRKTRKCSNATVANDAAEVPSLVTTARGTKRKATLEQESPKKRRKADPSTKKSSCDVSHYNRSVENFKAKYDEIFKLGEGGFGSVYAGYRKADVLPVAIKHVRKENVTTRRMDLKDKKYMVPVEVIMMIRAAGGPEEIGQSAAVTLLDWFDLEQEDILVMERPVPAKDLYHYIYDNVKGPMEEVLAKNIMKQLVEAAIQMQSRGVFHRDIKSDNILVETNLKSAVTRVRVIDFGCSCFLEKGPCHKFVGTPLYAPPEFNQQGRYEAVPTTVWQLGALLYEMLTGGTQFSTFRFFINKSRLFQDLRRLNLSEDCYNFFEMCVTEDPNERATLKQMQQHPWFQ